jgi:DNA-binding ferritin-like protein
MSENLKNYISQLQITVPNGNNSAEIVKTLFRFRQQLHVYHWQTKSYARHKASDQLLGELTEFIDEFMETFFGKYGRVNFSKNVNINIGNMSDEEGLKFLDEMISYFINEYF